MFDKNYKNAMDKVTVDEQTREKILDKIILKEELKKRKNPAIPWRVAFACAACVAIVLGVVFVPRDTFKPATTTSEVQQLLQVSKSYDEIYELIKPKKEFNLWELFGTSDDEAIEDIVVEENIYTEDLSDGDAKPGAVPGDTNASANNSASDSKNETNIDIGTSDKDDFSTTTEQVEGVNEADIVKTDGKYIYYVSDTMLNIVKAHGANSTLISQTQLSKVPRKDLYGEMFLKDDRIVLLKSDNYVYDEQKVIIEVYDITDRTAPKKMAESCQDGWYTSSRMVGDYVYLISNCNINIEEIDQDDPTTFVPTTEINGVCEPVPADSIYRYEQESYTNKYTVIGAFNYKDGALNDTVSLLGGTDNIYCSGGNIILADRRYNNRDKDDDENERTYIRETTVVSKLSISGGEIEYKTSGEVDGTLQNQFFIDEHNDYFRFVTTVTKSVEKRYKFDNSEHEVVSYTQETFAALTVLDSELKKVGEIGNLAKGESVYSVRFMGDIAYFVTFRQTDPLFSADLSDPANPKILGELKIPGFSEYMYPYGEGLLLGFGMDADENTGRTGDLKLSMFNTSNPANVTEDDKTIVEGCQYSPALSSHKAMLVHPSKNLIAFAATDDWQDEKYMIYEYTGEGFECKAIIDIKNYYNYFAMTDIRGLFVNDIFYVVSADCLQVFDMDTFEQVKQIDF